MGIFRKKKDKGDEDSEDVVITCTPETLRAYLPEIFGDRRIVPKDEFYSVVRAGLGISDRSVVDSILAKMGNGVLKQRRYNFTYFPPEKKDV
ncbi:MAG: hypothetical protein ABIG28_02715 [archaeon]